LGTSLHFIMNTSSNKHIHTVRSGFQSSTSM